MFVRYGNFDFEPWEASLSVFAEFVRSPRGFKHMQNIRYDIHGELCIDTGQYDVNTRLAQIVNAFSVDGRSCGLMHDDGQTTIHWLPNSASQPANLTDVQVFYKRFPPTRDGEFVSGRKFEIGVGAMLLDPGSALLAFQETLGRKGNAGPVFRWRYTKFRGWYPYLESPSAMQKMVQKGFAIGAYTYPLPPVPLYPIPFEDNQSRAVNFIGPQRYPAGYTGFKTEWEYTYNLPTFDDISRPNLG